MIYDLQKANMWKRISAYLCDIILLSILAVGAAFLLSSVLGYDSYSLQLEECYTEYENEYSVDFDIPAAEYELLSEEEKENYNNAFSALTGDEDFNYVYSMLINLTLIIITFGILISYLVLEFLVPILFKNGQTIGKKVFGVGVMRVDGVKLSPLLLFIRTVLGKFTVETMVPVMLAISVYFGLMGIEAIIIMGFILLIQIIMISATKTNSAIHDMISQTVTVDFASQLIFNSPAELTEYKKRLHENENEKHSV